MAKLLMAKLLMAKLLMAKLLMAIREKFMAVPEGNAHAVRPGYASIDADPAMSGPQEHSSC